jgi:rhodanese-related sulfurtransferase
MAHREFKDRVYPQFARVAQALASDRRLELLDLLAQAPRHVEALAAETGMSVANVSQHLQTLRAAHLVEAARAGQKTIYCLAGVDVLRLWLALRSVAEARLPDMALIPRPGGEADDTVIDEEELARRLQRDRALLIDVRPPLEYEDGHLPGALSFPPDQLPGRLDELPRDRPIVAYCRGAYCLFADEAVELLRSNGFDAYRLDVGWAEWLAAHT